MEFDLVLLGLGEDGHTASLFPSQPLGDEDDTITDEEYEAALAEPLVTQPRGTLEAVTADYFAEEVRRELAQRFGEDALYKGGLSVRTSLDPELQAIGEQVVADQIAALQDKNVKNGALLALDPRTGEILAMVGSPDFNDDAIGGQINMTLRPRQTGSVIKPFTYLAAFEKGWSPATVLWDTPVSYTDTAGNVYQPRNYDGKFHGPQTVRSSVASSYNIPAVKTLADGVGIPDFLALMRRLGVDTLTRPDYGPALTLGGGEVPLIEMTTAFGALANNGVYTQMLESMTENRRPTRAEATHVSNAVLDGTDCVMLSGESAMGKYPVDAVEILVKIAAEVEAQKRQTSVHELYQGMDIRSHLKHAHLIAIAVEASLEYADPAAVFVPTHSGATARRLSMFRLPEWIIGISSNAATCQGLVFSSGVYPVLNNDHPKDFTPFVRAWVKENGLPGEMAFLTEGPSSQHPGANYRMEIIDPRAQGPDPPPLRPGRARARLRPWHRQGHRGPIRLLRW